MSDAVIAAIEYETLVFSRHQTELPGRARRSAGVLDHSAYTLLTLLHVDGPASIGELSAITGLDASTLNRQTAAIVRDKFAVRIPDPAGGIARKFSLTDGGAVMLKEEREASRQALALIVSDWDESDRETLARLLMKLNVGIEARRGSEWPRPSGTPAPNSMTLPGPSAVSDPGPA